MEAKSRLLRQISMYPDAAVAFFTLAKIHAHEKHWEQAAKYLKTSIALDPSWAFWVRYEPFYGSLVAADPGYAAVVKDVANVYINRRVEELSRRL